MERTGYFTILGAAVVISIAVVVSFVTSTIVASRAYLRRGEQQHRQSRSLDVTGSAKARISSDLALWDIRVTGEAKTLEEAFQRLGAAVEKVQGFLSQRGFPAGAVVLDPIVTTTHYKRDDKGNETREVVAFSLTRVFKIKTGEIEKVSKAAGEVTELIRGGVPVESFAPSYICTTLGDLKLKMIGEATANARQRADKIATESGCKVGAVVQAKAGVFQVTPPWSTDVTSSGVNDTSTIEKDVTSVVHLTMMIEGK